jgi:hypothetical protein
VNEAVCELMIAKETVLGLTFCLGFTFCSFCKIFFRVYFASLKLPLCVIVVGLCVIVVGLFVCIVVVILCALLYCVCTAVFLVL